MSALSSTAATAQNISIITPSSPGRSWFAVAIGGNEYRFVPEASRTKQMFLKGGGYGLTSASPSHISVRVLCVKPDSDLGVLLHLWPNLDAFCS